MRSSFVLVSALLTPFALASCATTLTTQAQTLETKLVSEVCTKVFLKIDPSRKDTPETLEQVLAHNRAWTAFCKA